MAPVAASMRVTKAFQVYSTGVFQDREFTQEKLLNPKPSVLTVGFGVGRKFGDYWIVKYSWGEECGEFGYERITRNTPFNCGISLLPVLPKL